MKEQRRVKTELKKTVKPIKPKSNFYKFMNYVFNANSFL